MPSPSTGRAFPSPVGIADATRELPAAEVAGATSGGRAAPARPPRHGYLAFSPPSVGADEIAEVVDVLRSDWLSTGPKTRQFEHDFAAYLGAPGALALNSCTAGLHTALTVLGVGAGDEVVTSPMTFVATANVIEHVGAKPVLVDVEPDTLNLDPGLIEAAITPRTRAILPVHFAGHPADLAPIEAIAAARGLAIVEDAAHALPAAYRGRRIGAGPHLTAFSFYATKNLTTGEGGMLTGEPALLERARVVSLHGLSRDALARYEQGGHWFYEVHAPGFKYNMSDLQAALGLAQLRRLAGFQTRRAEVVARYDAAFADEEALELPARRPDVEHAWHLYPLRLRPGTLRIDRDQVIRELAGRNIGTSVHFIPVHLHPYYRNRYGYRPDSFPVAFGAYQRCLSLPLNPRLADDDVDDVIDAVRSVVRAHRR